MSEDKIVNGYYQSNITTSRGENITYTTEYAIDKLQQENKQLKEELQKADSITQSCIFEGKEESTINFRECLNKLELYKEVIEEVREYIIKHQRIYKLSFKDGKYEYIDYELSCDAKEMLQILDKAKENK